MAHNPLFDLDIPADNRENSTVEVNFPQVSMYELAKFAARFSGYHFIADPNALNFEVSFVSGVHMRADQVLNVVIQMLKDHGFDVSKKHNSLLIYKASDLQKKSESTSQQEKQPQNLLNQQKELNHTFHIFKLEYHYGKEILDILQNISKEMIAANNSDKEIIETITSMQWVPSTNSLFFSGSEEGVAKVCSLISSLDTPLKQVLIEILVLESSLQDSLEFGLELSAKNKHKHFTTEAANNFSDPSQWDLNSPTSPFPPFKIGFDLGIIGDMIFHKGRSFFTLGAFLTALQQEGKHTIVLNQKLITQENKVAKIFVGENIPYAGAVVQTIGAGQQTTTNIEHKDVGILLNIIVLIGTENNIVTADITQEITEAIHHPIQDYSKTTHVNGITTSKTNMVTSAHIPENHFLILTGSTKTVKHTNNQGIPCLGGIPLIGTFFQKKRNSENKRNLLVFIKPHIIRSIADYEKISASYEQEISMHQETSLEKEPLTTQHKKTCEPPITTSSMNP